MLLYKILINMLTSTIISSYALKSSGIAIKYNRGMIVNSVKSFSTISDREKLNVETAENVVYDNFTFELLKQDTKSRARLGIVGRCHYSKHAIHKSYMRGNIVAAVVIVW